MNNRLALGVAMCLTTLLFSTAAVAQELSRLNVNEVSVAEAQEQWRLAMDTEMARHAASLSAITSLVGRGGRGLSPMLIRKLLSLEFANHRMQIEIIDDLIWGRIFDPEKSKR